MKPRKRMATIAQPALYDLRKPREKGGELLDIEGILLELGVPIPECEYVFAPTQRGWRFDYAWPAYRVALEREGGTWGRKVVTTGGEVVRVVQGRHVSPVGIAEDCAKYNHANALGWHVLRATVDMVRQRLFDHDLVDTLRRCGWKGV